jgi:hypothetical protein
MVIQAVSVILVIPVIAVVLVILILLLTVVPDVLFPSRYSSTVFPVLHFFCSGSALNTSPFYLLFKNSSILFVITVWKRVYKIQDDSQKH